MLKLENIDLALWQGSKLERKILQKLNLTVNKGELIIVIGGNGTGKSTMLNVISGELTPTTGKIILDNEDITNIPQYKRSVNIAKVMQDPKVGTMENMTILENMAFAYMRGANRGFYVYNNTKREKLFQEKLSMLGMGLENRLNELVANLSGGQRQALSLIMAIIANSKLLLLDEITAALDPKMAESVLKIAIQIITEAKLTTIMITHNMTHAIQYGNRTLLLANGEFVKEFTYPDKSTLTPLTLAAEFGIGA